jgi:hypothetical protein
MMGMKLFLDKVMDNYQGAIIKTRWTVGKGYEYIKIQNKMYTEEEEEFLAKVAGRLGSLTVHVVFDDMKIPKTQNDEPKYGVPYPVDVAQLSGIVLQGVDYDKLMGTLWLQLEANVINADDLVLSEKEFYKKDSVSLVGIELAPGKPQYIEGVLEEGGTSFALKPNSAKIRVVHDNDIESKYIKSVIMESDIESIAESALPFKGIKIIETDAKCFMSSIQLLVCRDPVKNP